jgi:hypothetical protein
MDLSTITVAGLTGDVSSLAVVVIGGLAVIWSIRKLIKLTNRS